MRDYVVTVTSSSGRELARFIYQRKYDAYRARREILECRRQNGEQVKVSVMSRALSK